MQTCRYKLCFIKLRLLIKKKIGTTLGVDVVGLGYIIICTAAVYIMIYRYLIVTHVSFL